MHRKSHVFRRLEKRLVHQELLRRTSGAPCKEVHGLEAGLQQQSLELGPLVLWWHQVFRSQFALFRSIRPVHSPGIPAQPPKPTTKSGLYIATVVCLYHLAATKERRGAVIARDQPGNL